MSTATATRSFTTVQVCTLAGISYRQADYWTRMGYVSPDHDGGQGAGHERRWSAMEAAKAIALAGMLRAGITHARAVELIKAGRTAHLVTAELRDAIIDDLPPDSRPTLVVRAAGS